MTNELENSTIEKKKRKLVGACGSYTTTGKERGNAENASKHGGNAKYELQNSR